MKDTVDAGWVTKDAVCAGVAAGSVPASAADPPTST